LHIRRPTAYNLGGKEEELMKVLGIVASPRKGGNTEIMVSEALAVARAEGAETEIFLIHDKTINGCDACGACRNNGKCVVKDDMQLLYPLMDEADAIIFGSPVYFHGVTAQAKAIIDRTFCYLMDHGLKGKVAASVLTLRRLGAGQTRVHVYGWFLTHGMVPVKGAIGYGRERGDVRTSDGAGIGMTAMDEARETGKDVMALLKKLNP
jgi:multimeric flavodoxin WrbA